jgi:hypothetical protein
VPTRIFQGVQQPVCIVVVSRSKKTNLETPAFVRFRALHTGKREIKFEALKKIHLSDAEWIDCPTDWRAVSACFARSMGELPETGEPICVQRLRRTANADVGNRARCDIAGETLACTCRSSARDKGTLVPSHSA